MTEELLPLYNRELAAFRRLAGEFAEAHPKIAGRLRLSADTVEDPHVSRLIESVAFLNARVRQRLDDDFPELSESLLRVLYPHLLAPIPSMSIVQFQCDRELAGSYQVPVGTRLETDAVQGEPCMFRTVYPVETWPLEIESAKVQAAPFNAPALPERYAGVLHLVLKTRIDKVTFPELGPARLRLYLRGDTALRNDLYELLLNDVARVAVATGPGDKAPALQQASAIRAVGFEPEEGLLPYSPRSFLGYRLLSDYFVFPEKYLFVDIDGLDRHPGLGNRLHLFLYLRRTSDDLEQGVSHESFALGCTPMVNLFRRRAEPIPLDGSESSHHVVPDARRPLHKEVYSIESVQLTEPDGRSRPVVPIYGARPLGQEGGGRLYWSQSRTSTLRADGRASEGDEVSISLVDPDFEEHTDSRGVLGLEVTCFNRDLPRKLPFGGDRPALRLREGGGPLEKIRCLTPPSKALRPSKKDGASWKLVSHLLLNHLSLGADPESTQAFRELLGLYDFSGSQANRSVIEGLLEVEARPKVLRVLSGGLPGVARGIEVRLQFDESKYAGRGAFLFASVLERFLSHYASINSFVQVVFTSSTREGEIRRWQPRSGQRTLI